MRQSSVGVPRTSIKHHTATRHHETPRPHTHAARSLTGAGGLYNEILWLYLHVESEIPLTALHLIVVYLSNYFVAAKFPRAASEGCKDAAPPQRYP